MREESRILFAALLAALLAAPAFAAAQGEGDEAEGDAAGAAEEPGEAADEGTTAEVEETAAIVDEEPAVEEPAPAPAAPAASPVQGTWTKKIEFASEDGNFKLQPTGFVQPKLQLLINPDADDQLAGSGFLFQRARMGFKATVFKIGKLALDADFKSGSLGLVDFYADVDPFGGLFAVRVGRFRPWFGRQFMSATTMLQMVEVAKWTDDKLGLGLDRDLGLGVFGLIADTFEYGVGVWNGDGASVFDPNPKVRDIPDTTDAEGNKLVAPANIDVMVGGRLAVHPLAPLGVGRALPTADESDCAISEKPGLALGVSAYFNKRHDRVATNVDGADLDALYYDNQLKLGVDLAFQMIGLSIVGEFYMHKVWLADDTPAAIVDFFDGTMGSNAKGALVDGVGFGAYGQVGYFVLPKQLEVAARFDMVDENKEVRGVRLYPGAGASYYFFGNNLKVQLMYRLNLGSGYEETDPGYIQTSHDLFLMLQASI